MRSLLEILSGGAYVSGEAISAELGVSRAAVWKQVEGLRRAGWQIDSGGKRGYRLEAGDSLHPALWQGMLGTSRLGRGEIRFEETLDSTNSELKRLAAAGAPHGSVALCERQTAGRGRMGRTWVSEPGVGLWMSVLLRPQLPPERAPLLTFAAALAMRAALRGACGLDCGIKWPNDLVHGGKKLCGILLEVSAEPDQVEYVVVGTGLNVLPGAVPAELRGQAACVADFVSPPRRREIVCRYLEALEALADAVGTSGWQGVGGPFREASVTIGQRVLVSGAESFTGVAEDVDDTGALLVRTEDGTVRRVLAGDVSVRGLMGYV